MRLFSLLLAFLLLCGCQTTNRIPSIKTVEPTKVEKRLVMLRESAKRLVSALSKEAQVVVLARGNAAHAMVVGPLTKEEGSGLAVGLMALLSFDYENVVVTVNNGMFKAGDAMRPNDGMVGW